MSSSITNIMLSSLQPTTTTTTSTSSYSPHLLPKISRSSQNASRRRKSTTTALSIRSSSEQKPSGEESSPLIMLDRRNVLLGLGGGLYGAAAGLGGSEQLAVATPLGPPDLSKCGIANSSGICYHCCPPYGPNPPKLDDIPFYQIPKTEKTRVRMPAHKMTADQLTKFKTAIQKMKELPETDPRNFFQQAQIHCAYCNEAYDQVGYDQNPDREKNVALQVHFSWIFLPWHRWYLYFYEKILGSLIGDDSFALPYWNYDNPDGMRFPAIYTDCSSPLFDPIRNLTNCSPQGPKLVDLTGTEPATEEQQIKDNLAYVKTVFDENKGLPEAFIGDSVEAGERNEESNSSLTSGQLENLHNVVHVWAGSSASPNFNMGNFVSAARDPVFFGHHANVDRLWEIYRKKVMKPSIESDSKDWLEATFLFFDENQKIVKVNVRDCLDPIVLGYDYQDMSQAWETASKKTLTSSAKTRTAAASRIPVAEFGPVPRLLDETPIRALVKRPRSSRGASEVDQNVEALIIDGIEIEHSTPTRFNVYVTKPTGKFASADYGQFAGSFVTAAHGHRTSADEKKSKKLRLKLGITELIKDIDAETSESLVVTLVPILSSAVIGGVRIEQPKSK